MAQQEFSAKESLQLIESMISQAQNRFHENGHLYLLWGWVILFCSVTSFVSVYFFNDFSRLDFIWVLTIPTFIYQVVYLTKHRKKERVRTYTDDISNYVWLAFVIMGFVSGIVIFRSGAPQLFNSVILLLYGMPTFLSGVILRFMPLRMGGIGCWVLAVISSFIGAQFSFLLLAVAVIVAWIIPGYLLRSRFLKHHTNA